MKKRILIVEDDIALAEGLKLNAELEGYTALVAPSAEDARVLLAGGGIDLVLLDVGLPGDDGFTLCAELREGGFRAPILFLTARDEDRDRVRGLREGADDYIVKPFHLDELLARIRAFFRRADWEQERGTVRKDVVIIGGSRVDFRRARVDGPRGSHPLGEKELAILTLLVEREGEPVDRRTILDRVWGYESYPTTRTVDNFILRLRRLLEPDPAAPRHIITVHRVGYRLHRDAGDGS
jgi:DNA-binding response OmpR family regulator